MKGPLLDQSEVKLLNKSLDLFFEESIENAATIDPSYKQLWINLHSLIRSGGKRIRPQLTLLVYKAFGGDNIKQIMPVGVAQELLHFSLLIHDDIIDRDYVRYGVANIAGRQKISYSQFVSSEEDLTHYANSAALLAGDLMLSAAYQLIANSGLPNKDKMVAQQLLSRGIFEVAGGELLDTELSFSPYKKGDALKVATHKTASYSFMTPLVTGAYLAGANEDECNKLRKLATSLGIAYQLTDDILGIFGDESITGKSTASDIVEGKRTHLVEMALEKLSASEQVIFMLAFGNPMATPLEIKASKQLLESSGALLRTEQEIQRHTSQALYQLDSLNWPAAYKERFIKIIDSMTHRKS